MGPMSLHPAALKLFWLIEPHHLPSKESPLSQGPASFPGQLRLVTDWLGSSFLEL